MSAAWKAAAAGCLFAGCYFAFALEASLTAPNVLPHAPLAFLVWAVWALPASAGVIIAALIGFGCDLLNTGPLGPTVIAATTAAFVAGAIRRRWELESSLALLVFAAGISITVIAGQAWAGDLLEGRVGEFRETSLIAAGRAVSTAVLAIVPTIIVRMIDRMRRIATAL